MKMPDPLQLSNTFKEFRKGETLIPGGVLGIRRPYNFVEGEYPIYFARGSGGHVIDIDGNEYIDYLCAYGPIIIGHREEEIDTAVMAQMREKGFCFSLSQSIQNELAEKMNRLIPCSEMSIFVKTGSDATTCAIRVARAYTGRTKILRCGYHGWHDWCVEVKGGIPKKAWEDVHEFHYNDTDHLESLLKAHGTDTAAVIITPFGHPLAYPLEEPKPGFLQGVQALAQKYGAVLIFDEIRTGFRISMGGAQQYYGITPDLSTFGKAMANGYPIAALTGKKEIMKKAEKEVFISSTYFPNSLEFVAALKTIEILERDKVLDSIWEKGEKLNDGIRKALGKHPESGAVLSGIPPMMFITFARDEQELYRKKRNDFYTFLIRRGIFLQPYHHGYICHRHTMDNIERTIRGIEEALLYLKETY